MSLIQNFEKLAHSPLRKASLLLVEEGIRASNVENLLKRNVYINEKEKYLKFNNFWYKEPNRVFCVFVGEMVPGAEKQLVEMLPSETEFREWLNGSADLPTNLTKDDLVIYVIGDLTEIDLLTAKLVQALVNLGISGEERRLVRRHIDGFSGGRGLYLAWPAQVLSLEFSKSDVMQKAESTVNDASYILNKYNVLEESGLPSINLFEIPKHSKYFNNHKQVVLDNNLSAINAMQKKASDLGLKLSRSVDSIEDSLKALKDDQVLLNFLKNSDSTAPMGHIADSFSLKRAKNLGMDVNLYPKTFGDYEFFEELGDAIYTEDTEPNVLDFRVLIKK